MNPNDLSRGKQSLSVEVSADEMRELSSQVCVVPAVFVCLCVRVCVSSLAGDMSPRVCSVWAKDNSGLYDAMFVFSNTHGQIK